MVSTAPNACLYALAAVRAMRSVFSGLFQERSSRFKARHPETRPRKPVPSLRVTQSRLERPRKRWPRGSWGKVPAVITGVRNGPDGSDGCAHRVPDAFRRPKGGAAAERIWRCFASGKPAPRRQTCAPTTRPPPRTFRAGEFGRASGSKKRRWGRSPSRARAAAIARSGPAGLWAEPPPVAFAGAGPGVGPTAKTGSLRPSSCARPRP